MTPLGRPVVPELYSQKPGVSAVVEATGASEMSVNDAQSCTGTPAASTTAPGPITTAARSWSQRSMMAGRQAAYGAESTTTPAPASATMAASSSPVSIVDSGT